MSVICAGALEYSQGKRLDGSPCTYVRLRLLVEDARLWLEEANMDIEECLAVNEIAVHGLSPVDGATVARIDCAKTRLQDFEEWTADTAQGLHLRTFLNVLGPDGTSLFGKDDCWNTIHIEGRPINYWYQKLADIKLSGYKVGRQ
jgi:hypothetical protein